LPSKSKLCSMEFPKRRETSLKSQVPGVLYKKDGGIGTRFSHHRPITNEDPPLIHLAVEWLSQVALVWWQFRSLQVFRLGSTSLRCQPFVHLGVKTIEKSKNFKFEDKELEDFDQCRSNSNQLWTQGAQGRS
jgi:hypothetical protein